MTDTRKRAVEVIIDGVTDDLQTYRDTLYFVADGDVDVAAEIDRLVAEHGLSRTTVWDAPEEAWDESPLTPAHLDRDTFASLVTLVPHFTEAFGQLEQVWLDLDDE